MVGVEKGTEIHSTRTFLRLRGWETMFIYRGNFFRKSTRELILSGASNPAFLRIKLFLDIKE